MKINLTEEQFKNLKVFLNRCRLDGFEVQAFVELLNAINTPEKEKS